jgi:hypothetical protein
MSAIRRTFVLMAVAVTLVAPDTGAHAATAAHIDVGVKMALRVLYASSAGARALRSKAKAILVFLLRSRRDEAVRQRGQLPRDVQELRGGRTSDHV